MSYTCAVHSFSDLLRPDGFSRDTNLTHTQTKLNKLNIKQHVSVFIPHKKKITQFAKKIKEIYVHSTKGFAHHWLYTWNDGVDPKAHKRSVTQ